jgi:phospho-N-acetylmuramoyl-pentapeptide-transferase
MLYTLFQEQGALYYLIAGGAAFLLTLLGLVFGRKFLPKDQGREFAVNGALSKGKDRGAGLILIIALIAAAVLLVPLDLGMIVLLAALFFEMMSGYLDDASEKPWGELIKGVIDLLISIVAAVIAFQKTSGSVVLSLCGTGFQLPAWGYIPLAVILIWVSINVTNCADGVDGLCTSLSLTTLGSALVILLFASGLLLADAPMAALVWMSLFVLVAYLWFNCSPSSMLMGDAGSRALGLLIAMAFLLTGDPFLFIPCALLLILDGGLGLLKLTVLRVTKSKTFMKNIRTPLHDHARKNKGWSDTQVVTRFTLMQILLSAVTVLLVFGRV